MEPAVPFALLGTAQLLAVAAWAGLAAVALARAGLSGSVRSPSVLLLVAGAAVLVPVETGTALALGSPTSDLLAGLRTGGLLLLGAGLALGALASRPRGRRPPSLRVAGAPAVAALPVVVVPLGAGSLGSTLAAVGGVAAAGGALRGRWDLAGAVLALALVLAGLTGPVADGHPLPGLVLRAASALLLLSVLVLLARSSLLGQVVAAILAGVLVMAIAAVGVVGSVVVRSYDGQARDAVGSAAEQTRQELAQYAGSRRLPATLLRAGCPVGAAATRCAQVLALVEPSHDVVVRVPRAGAPVALAARGTRLTPGELLGLRRDALVQRVLAAQPAAGAAPATGLVRLAGGPPAVAALAVAADPGRDARGRPTSVLVYVARLDDGHLAERLGAVGGPGRDPAPSDVLTLLVDGQVAASDALGAAREQVRAAVAQLLPVPAAGATAPARGAGPTVGVLPVGKGDGLDLLVAVARGSERSLAVQRDALRALVLTALGATGVVGALALLLGRRTVRPVRRLTAAAEQVAAGDLSVRTAVRGRDEVAVLSTTFDAMTGSLGRARDDLRTSAARLQAVLGAMSEGLVAADRQGRVTGINPAALALVGLDSEQAALGRPLGEVVRVRGPHGADVVAGPGPQREGADGVVLRPDGSWAAVRVEAADLPDDAGRVLVLRDTTREREVERMKTEFLSNVSHELRTPLTPIRGYAELLASRPGLPAESVATFAGTILAESLKMNRVVDLLVDVAAIEAGRVQVRPRPVEVADLLDPRLAAWQVRVPERSADLVQRTAAGLPPVLVDPEWVGKALDELLDNALRHTPPGTSVLLGAAPGPDGRVQVFVADQGPGIDRDDQRLLLRSFEQVDGGATRRVGGLGLGLSFVSRLAQDAGYPLTVSSVPGEGSRFSLDLPTAGIRPAS